MARWLTVLALASNDFFRMFQWVEEATDAGTRVMAYRIQAAAIYEAASHLSDTLRRWPEARAFVEGLDPAAREEAERVQGAVDSASEHYLGDWIEPHRNVTFHYAEMHPQKAEHDQEEIKRALETAADIQGEIRLSEGDRR